jgi:hypothetical protein
MHIMAKTGPAFGPDPASLGSLLQAGAVVVLVVLAFLACLALVRLVFAP